MFEKETMKAYIFLVNKLKGVNETAYKRGNICEDMEASRRKVYRLWNYAIIRIGSQLKICKHAQI